MVRLNTIQVSKIRIIFLTPWLMKENVLLNIGFVKNMVILI